MLYYINDPSLRAQRNVQGEDYTPAYIPAMLAFVGATGTPITADALATLKETDVVLIAADRPTTLSDCAATAIVMGAPENGCAPVPRRHRHIYGEYLTADGKALPVFVPFLPAPAADEVLAYADVGTERIPALIRRGKHYEFLFDLPATLWFSGDGFMEMQNDPYFPVGRTPDWRPLPNGRYGTLPYNDLLLLELERLLHSLGVCTIYRLPPMENGEVPDLVLHFSGDDDCCSATINRNAAARMKEVGFPYHINAMPNGLGQFIFDRDVLAELNQNGCELGLHLDLTCAPYTARTVKAQFEQFREAFGIHPITNVNHCLVQHGTQAEFLRWLQDCDIIADNGYLGTFDPNDINAFDLCEFGYGTSFPRFSCDDAAHGNTPLRPVLIPITYYEARLPQEDSDTTKVLTYLDNAAANARITQFFFHPHYLNDDNPHCVAALRVLSLIKQRIAQKGYRALPMTTNTIAAFWQARAKATVTQTGNTITVKTDAPLLLRLAAPAATVTLDDAPCSVTRKDVEGRTAYLLAIPAGMHEVIVK